MNTETLRNRFPIFLSKEICEIEKYLDLSSKHESYEPFEISLEREDLVIPKRIYADPSQLKRLTKFSLTQKEMVYCFYSRHYDGYVRERCLIEIVGSNNYFCIPFILQLLGEYVIEIIECIYNNREN